MKEKEIEKILSNEHLSPGWVKEAAKKIGSLFPAFNESDIDKLWYKHSIDGSFISYNGFNAAIKELTRKGVS
jgi:hypothetical protein